MSVEDDNVGNVDDDVVVVIGLDYDEIGIDPDGTLIVNLEHEP